MPKQLIPPDIQRQIDENILKTIKELQLKKGEAHVSDLMREMNMTTSTAYATVTRLVQSGYLVPLRDANAGINSREKRAIVFTNTGENIANTLLERHQLLQQWLIRLGSTQEDADQAACSMEHGISDHALAIISRHVDMASQFSKSGASAQEIMEKMQKMQAAIQATDQEADKLLSNELRRTVEKAGGIEGITRKEAMIAEAGGEQELLKLLERIEELGGIHSIEWELGGKERFIKRAGGQKKLDYMLRFADQFRDLEEMERYIQSAKDALAFIKKAGSMEQAEELRATVRYLNKHGGIESFKQMLKIADKYGGVEDMTNLLAAERKIWSKALKLGKTEENESGE